LKITFFYLLNLSTSFYHLLLIRGSTPEPSSLELEQDFYHRIKLTNQAKLS